MIKTLKKQVKHVGITNSLVMKTTLTAESEKDGEPRNQVPEEGL